jgi:GT2 family glycosyltransferase
LSSLRFSVVVPAHRNGPRLRQCVAACLALEHPNVELVVVTDRPLPEFPDGVRMIETGVNRDTSPAEKRDLASNQTSGDVLAYLDDDAYPAADWLTNAARLFADEGVAAAGGPGLTPPSSPWRERVGGAVYESWAGSALLRHRFLPLARRWVDDYPAYNLLVRREALDAVGGWGTTFYGGEDTVLCLKLAAAGQRVLYSPEVRVFHHRRPVLGPHLRQVANVGRHRGHFVRRYPATSRRALYFLPAVSPVVLALAGVLCARRPRAGLPLLAAAYAAVAGETLRRHPLSVAAATPLAAVAHHLAYGLAFVRGWLGPPLER